MMSTRNTTVVDFIKSEEFSNLITAIVKCETSSLKQQIEELKSEVITLRESNIELVNLLTNVNQQQKYKYSDVLMESVKNSSNTAEVCASRKTANYDKKKGDRRNQINTTVFVEEDCSSKEKEFSVPGKEVHTPENKWEFPKRRFRKTRNAPIYGKANEDMLFKGVIKYNDYHVYRLPPNLKEEDIVQHLKNKDITEIKCEKMQSRRPDEYASFKISVSLKQDRQFRNPKIWPEYVVVNRFLHKLVEKGNIR